MRELGLENSARVTTDQLLHVVRVTALEEVGEQLAKFGSCWLLAGLRVQKLVLTARTIAVANVVVDEVARVELGLSSRRGRRLALPLLKLVCQARLPVVVLVELVQIDRRVFRARRQHLEIRRNADRGYAVVGIVQEVVAGAVDLGRLGANLLDAFVQGLEIRLLSVFHRYRAGQQAVLVILFELGFLAYKVEVG